MFGRSSSGVSPKRFAGKRPNRGGRGGFRRCRRRLPTRKCGIGGGGVGDVISGESSWFHRRRRPENDEAGRRSAVLVAGGGLRRGSAKAKVAKGGGEGGDVVAGESLRFHRRRWPEKRRIRRRSAVLVAPAVSGGEMTGVRWGNVKEEVARVMPEFIWWFAGGIAGGEERKRLGGGGCSGEIRPNHRRISPAVEGEDEEEVEASILPVFPAGFTVGSGGGGEKQVGGEVVERMKSGCRRCVSEEEKKC